MSFFEELKRRNVFRVGIAYVVVGWLLLQVTDIVVPILDLPEWVDKLVLFLIVLGFPLVIFFAWAFELTPEGVKREKDVDRSSSITNVTGRKLDRAIIGILVIALGWFAWDKFARTTSVPTEGPVSTAEAPVEETTKSIAVLPFVNMSEDSANEYFSDGISEEILNALAKVKDLQVAGRTSSFAFKGRNEDLREIGETLGVNHILEGSVRKAGNTVRVTAQLIQVDDGFHLWSESYDRELTNVFAIQDEIATAILSAMKAELLEGESEALASTETDPQVYELYLLAKQGMLTRKRDSIEAAAQMLDSALEIDPDYAPALAQRGIATLLLKQQNYGSIPSEQADPIAKDFLDRSVDLDPDLAEGWAGLGLYYREQPTGQKESIESLEKALAINPNLINASNWLQAEYLSIGDYEKGSEIIEDMVTRDPLYRPGIGNAVWLYVSTGQPQRASDLLDRVEPFMPNDPHMIANRGFVAQSRGDLPGGMNLVEKSLEMDPDSGSKRVSWGVMLLATHQYEKLLSERMPPWQRTFSLHVTGRTEEATIRAYERAAEGEIADLFQLMNRDGRPADLVDYFNERWTDLDAFQAQYPGWRLGYDTMLALAYAFHKTGDETRFTDAMGRLEAHYDKLAQAGLYLGSFDLERSEWHVMSGNLDAAVELVESAINKGEITALPIAWEYPALTELEGDPRFEALQDKMIENLNRYRAELGLEPIET